MLINLLYMTTCLMCNRMIIHSNQIQKKYCKTSMPKHPKAEVIQNNMFT